MPDFVRAQKLLGYSFSDVSLLERALTHTSYANEHSERGHWDSNQRLEFLGDSVLGLVISTYMYANYPGMAEGELSRFRSNIVCEETLYEVASVFCLGEFMLFGRGEILTGGSRKISVLADCVESVIAAVYLDSGFESACRFVLDNLGFRKRIDTAGSGFAFSDHKSALQEFFHDPAVQIYYSITGRGGPDHDPFFEAEVSVSRNGAPVCTARGKGGSKKAAEQDAAGKALAELNASGNKLNKQN